MASVYIGWHFPPRNWSFIKHWLLCTLGSSFHLKQFLTLFRPSFFYHWKVQGGSLGTSLMISGTIKASPMKLCTVIVLFRAYQNTKKNCQKYDLWRHNYVITKKPMVKFGPSRNQTNYISFERLWWEPSENVIFIEIDWLNQTLGPFK